MRIIYDHGDHDLLLTMPVTHPYIYADGTSSAEPRDCRIMQAAWDLDLAAITLTVEIVGTPIP